MSVNGDIRELVEDILRKCDITPPVDIKYYPGSEAGDGFATKTLAVDVTNPNGSLYLFLKYGFDESVTDKLHLHKVYANEAYFYDIIRPEYEKFATERNVEGILENVPKCYGTSANNIVALENIRKRNFVLLDKSKCADDAHLTLVLRTLAKLHAISFSFKDRNAKEYRKLIEDTVDIFYTHGKTLGIDKNIKSSIEEFLSKSDPAEDKHILDALRDKADTLTDTAVNIDQALNKYTILLQGDCWVNNMMFQYEANERDPKNMMLFDWQTVRQASPVFDLSCFFYTTASRETLSRLSHYQGVYHQELSKQIRRLGSDPDKVYPYSALEADWKRFGKYGFALAFLAFKAVLYSKEEIPSFEDTHENPEIMFPAMKDDKEYVRRLKILAEHFIEEGLL